MPSALLHLALGLHCLDQCDWQPRENAPVFALGLIAPDVRNLTGASRAATHFWDRHNDLSGAVKLFARYPELVSGSAGSATMQAYLIGYVCHLVVDEQWIFTIYRRYFGRYSRYTSSPEGAALQLALYAVLEANSQFASTMATGVRLLAQAEHPPDLPWARASDVHHWGHLVTDQAALPPGLPRFRHVLKRTQRFDPHQVADLLARYPERARAVAAYVTDTDVERFVHRAIQVGSAVMDRTRQQLAGSSEAAAS